MAMLPGARSPWPAGRLFVGLQGGGEPLRRPASGLGDAAWIRGKIYHAALERFYGKLNEPAWPADHEPHLGAAIDSVFRDYGWQAMGVYPVLWLSAKETMTSAIELFARWDLDGQRAAGLRPAWLEKKLIGPLAGALPESLKGLLARGIVDRVDCDEAGKRFRVIDYKTHWRKKGKLSDLALKGELHQLPIYAELARLALGKDWKLEGAHLFVLEDSPETTGSKRSHDYPAAQWDQDSPAFTENVAAAVTRLAEGRFTINPDDGRFGHCTYCQFASPRTWATSSASVLARRLPQWMKRISFVLEQGYLIVLVKSWSRVIKTASSATAASKTTELGVLGGNLSTAVMTSCPRERR